MEPKIAGIGLRILFLLIPGIIAFGIVKSIGPKRPRTDFESGLQIFIYGVASYAMAGLISGIYVWISGSIPAGKTFWGMVEESSFILSTVGVDSNFGHVPTVMAALSSIFIGTLVANLQTHSIPHRILRTIKLTRRTSEVDMWELTLNSPDIDSWVTVRHHANGRIYQGWVKGYSDGGDERELILADVIVYVPSVENADQLVEVDSVPVLYLGLDRKNMVVELRQTDRSKTQKRNLQVLISYGRSEANG